MAIIITEEEHERAVFRSRRMYESDLASNLATAEDRGVKKVAKKMLAAGVPVNQIALFTDLPESEIKGL